MTETSQNMPIAFQGAPGAYSDLACRELFPNRRTLPCRAFEDVLAAVTNGEAALAVLPIENSVAGRVADVHHLLPHSGLHIIGEHFAPVNHHLLALPGVAIDEIKTIRSHVHALGQCRELIRKLGATPIVAADTAGAAAELAQSKDRTVAAIASELAGRIYGLVSLQANIEDAAHNTTRFVVLSREPVVPPVDAGLAVTSLVFRVRNVPASLYKAMGGFATNGVNMTKLESYMVGGRFTATEFYADVEAHPAERRLQLALEELRFFTEEVTILGTYPGHSYRKAATQGP
ncbi:MAG TPA: prephenate dehydratase [Aliidongia sp.]|nr:prephenate dehydratase [Aliidongia sp.]